MQTGNVTITATEYYSFGQDGSGRNGKRRRGEINVLVFRFHGSNRKTVNMAEVVTRLYRNERHFLFTTERIIFYFGNIASMLPDLW